MKHIFLYIALLALVGCGTSSQLPPFAASQWTLQGNTAASAARGMAVNFGESTILTNMSDGDYDLHFVTTPEQFAAGDAVCKDYIADAIKQIPLTIDSVEFILADQFIMLTPSVVNEWAPHIVRQADGAELVVEANPRATLVQPHDEIWRNVLVDKHLRRILVIDRIVKNGRHLAIVYILQSERKNLPFASTFHYDITAPIHIQQVGEHLRYLMDITLAATQ